MSERSSPPTDRISELPSCLIENILTRLTLKEAVKTNIVSAKWRNKWLSLTHLKFDHFFSWNFVNSRETNESDFFKTIFQVLLLHSNQPIHKITIYIPFGNRPEIDTLLSYLSCINIQGLSLSFRAHINKRLGNERLSSNLFSCLGLRYLELYNCHFYQQPAFAGFKHLSVLRLQYVAYRSYDLDIFITKCPLLESLIMEECHQADFNRSHSKLQINEFFTHLPLLKELELSAEFLEAMAPIPKRLLNPLNRLQCITLNNLSLSSMEHVSCALCLIQSSPNLTTLKIDQENVDANGVGEFLGYQGFSSITFNQLLEMTLLIPCYTRLGMELVRIILAKSPLLQRLHIRYKHIDEMENFKISEELIQFRRAFPRTKIIFDSPRLRARLQAMAKWQKKEGAMAKWQKKEEPDLSQLFQF